jgi:hypothetical protein
MYHIKTNLLKKEVSLAFKQLKLRTFERGKPFFLSVEKESPYLQQERATLFKNIYLMFLKERRIAHHLSVSLKELLAT